MMVSKNKFKIMVLFLTMISMSTSIAVGEAKINYRREIGLRNKKIEGLLNEFRNVQKQLSILKKQLTDIDSNILDKVNISNLDKKNYSYDRSGRKGIPVAEWLVTQDELIGDLEKDLKIIQKKMYIFLHYMSFEGISIHENILKAMSPLRSVFVSPFSSEQTDLYVNPEWQYDFSVGSIADVGEIKIFQIKKGNSTLVKVQYKPAYIDGLGVANRNTPKDKCPNCGSFDGVKGYFGDLKGESAIIQFRNFDFSKYPDGEKVKIDKRYIIVGTTTYKTAIGGSNTVFIAEPFKVNLK